MLVAERNHYTPFTACCLVISASLPTTTPELEEDTGRGSGFGDWVVTVYNNNFNTWDEVMMILQVATGCGPEEAYIETWEIDNLGCSVVHQGSQDECNKAAEVIATIGIKVQVSES